MTHKATTEQPFTRLQEQFIELMSTPPYPNASEAAKQIEVHEATGRRWYAEDKIRVEIHRRTMASFRRVRVQAEKQLYGLTAAAIKALASCLTGSAPHAVRRAAAMDILTRVLGAPTQRVHMLTEEMSEAGHSPEQQPTFSRDELRDILRLVGSEMDLGRVEDVGGSGGSA